MKLTSSAATQTLEETTLSHNSCASATSLGVVDQIGEVQVAMAECDGWVQLAHHRLQQVNLPAHRSEESEESEYIQT